MGSSPSVVIAASVAWLVDVLTTIGASIGIPSLQRRRARARAPSSRVGPADDVAAWAEKGYQKAREHERGRQQAHGPKPSWEPLLPTWRHDLPPPHELDGEREAEDGYGENESTPPYHRHYADRPYAYRQPPPVLADEAAPSITHHVFAGAGLPSAVNRSKTVTSQSTASVYSQDSAAPDASLYLFGAPSRTSSVSTARKLHVVPGVSAGDMGRTVSSPPRLGEVHDKNLPPSSFIPAPAGPPPTRPRRSSKRLRAVQASLRRPRSFNTNTTPTHGSSSRRQSKAVGPLVVANPDASTSSLTLDANQPSSPSTPTQQTYAYAGQRPPPLLQTPNVVNRSTPPSTMAPQPLPSPELLSPDSAGHTLTTAFRTSIRSAASSTSALSSLPSLSTSTHGHGRADSSAGIGTGTGQPRGLGNLRHYPSFTSAGTTFYTARSESSRSGSVAPPQVPEPRNVPARLRPGVQRQSVGPPVLVTGAGLGFRPGHGHARMQSAGGEVGRLGVHA